MKLKTMLLALSASLWMAPSLALAQGAQPAVNPSPAAVKAVDAIRYVKFIWVNPATKAFHLTVMKAMDGEIVLDQGGTGDIITTTPLPSGESSTLENTISVISPCEERQSELSCSGNINVNVPDTSPTGDDRLKQLVKKLKEYHDWTVSRPLLKPRSLGDKPAVNPRQPAVQPKVLQNPATREQPR